jgi:hypothetical protein
MFARGAVCACSPGVTPDHKEPGGYQVLEESEKTSGVCLISWSQAGQCQMPHRDIVEFLSNPVFHNANLSFILTLRRFYLQCT